MWPYMHNAQYKHGKEEYKINMQDKYIKKTKQKQYEKLNSVPFGAITC